MTRSTAIDEGAHYDQRVAKRGGPQTVNIERRYRERIAYGNYRWFLNNRLYESLRDTKPSKVLDVACGTGFYSVLLAKFGHQVVSIDISRKSVEYARQLAAINGCSDHIVHHVMDISNLDFEENSFDIVTGEDSIHHLIKYPNAIENMYSVLKPGGKGYFWEPFAYNPVINAMRFVNVRVKGHQGEHFLADEEVQKLISVFDEVEISDRAVFYAFARFFAKPSRVNQKVNIVMKKFDDFAQSKIPALSKYYSLAFVEMSKS